MAVPPSDKIPAAKKYRLQYIKQSNSSTMPTHLYDWAVSSNKKYLNYIYFQGQNNGSWYTPVEISATEDTLEFYVGRAGTAAASDFYIYVNGTQYIVGKWGYQVKCIFAAYSSIGSTANNLVASTIAPLYDPAYADTTASPIIINKLTQSQYESITPDDTQLYLITDANLETTNHKVQTIDANSTNTQYPSATAVNGIKYRGEPFWIQPTENGYVGFNISGTLNELGSRQISYSFDKSTWTSTTLGSLHSYDLISVNANQKIYFKSSATTDLVTESQGTYAKVVVKKTNANSGQNAAFITGGQLISLFNYQVGKTFYLFVDSKVTDASQLDVNYNDIACTCEYMFAYCSSLIKVPILSAFNLPDYAYHGMFDQCSQLTEVSTLPAETLSYACYSSMFSGCTALKYPPVINATSLSQMSCSHMFYGCTALETAPELLAEIMTTQCYQGMFRGCTSLKQIPKLYSTELAISCYNNMFEGCTALELQTVSDGTHYNIVKIPEKPEFNWELTWNNSMVAISSSWDIHGLSLTGLGFKSNNIEYTSLSIGETDNTISYDSTIVYNANGWVNSAYKTVMSTYNLSQHFTGTNWSSFFATNKNTNTSTTITVPSNAFTDMFANTGGSWTGTPILNKAYFTNAVLIPEANMSQKVKYNEV